MNRVATRKNRDEMRRLIGKNTRHYWPALVDALDHIDAMVEFLKEIEQNGYAGMNSEGFVDCCPSCQSIGGHRHDCDLARFLK